MIELSFLNRRGEDDSKSSLNLRLRMWFSASVTAYLVWIALKLLSIDWRQSEDPEMWQYDSIRWQLITTWFNLLMLGYYPLSCYCDWRESRGEGNRRHVAAINWLRHITFSAILFPTTIFADTLFWRLWNKDKSLIGPVVLEKYIPIWINHCLHTVTLGFVMVDLVLVPRRRPKSLRMHCGIMLAWVTIYLTRISTSWFHGIFVYPVVGQLSVTQLAVWALSMYTEHLMYFLLQWPIMALLHQGKNLHVE